MISYEPTIALCPVCGRLYVSVADRDEPVILPGTERRLGWWRTIRTYTHLDGTWTTTHRVPIGVAFERP